MKIRADIAAALHQGLTNTTIAAQCHTSHQTVAQARRILGVAPSKQGRRPAAHTIEDAFTARTEPVDGGHLRWTGHVDRHGLPIVSLSRDYQTAYRVAFRIRHDREPVGYAKPSCGMAGCVEPAHVEDQPMREQLRANYLAIFGSDS